MLKPFIDIIWILDNLDVLVSMVTRKCILNKFE